jgi:2-C-methyl-D-erythritol 2,4-cyclodiphosphate synthase
MFRTLALFFLLASPIESFAVTGNGPSNTNLAASVSTEDDILKPSYDIEPVSFRIGHGFDIHRMVPIGDAGQPLIIGGVEITHKDQKVCDPTFH